MGDSAIVETIGLGGFAMATATAVAGFVGAGSASEAANFTKAMYEITVGRNPDWTMPNLDYRRRSDRNRHSQGAANGHRAGHQHRHRSQATGRRPGRRRHRAGAACLLRARPRRARRDLGIADRHELNFRAIAFGLAIRWFSGAKSQQATSRCIALCFGPERPRRPDLQNNRVPFQLGASVETLGPRDRAYTGIDRRYTRMP